MDLTQTLQVGQLIGLALAGFVVWHRQEVAIASMLKTCDMLDKRLEKIERKL